MEGCEGVVVAVEAAEEEEDACEVVSAAMVDVDEEREKALAKGVPKWVSFSFLVNFHDMLGELFELGKVARPNEEKGISTR